MNARRMFAALTRRGTPVVPTDRQRLDALYACDTLIIEGAI